MKILFLILFILDALVHLFACLPPSRHTLRKVTKLLLMPLLLACYAFWAGTFSLPVALALLFSFAGDAFLIYPEKIKLFAAGIGAFGVAHICYTIALLGRIDARPSLWLVMIAVIVYAAGIVLMLRQLLPCLPEGLLIPCCIYMVLLCFTSLAAFVCMLGDPCTANVVIFAGSLLFLLSDAVLAIVTFRRDFALGYFVVMLAYIAAETMLAFGLAAY